jgi:pimeloyl-ACP methyl ester carboxylesterase
LGWLAAAVVLAALALLGAGGSSAATPEAAKLPTIPLPVFSGRAPGLPTRGTRAAPCGTTPGLVCSQVVVPLDRTGQVPGTVSLHVEVVPALGTPRGAMFLIAGGPGQGSAHVFGLDNEQAVSIYRYLFPGYTLVAYDDRGTGDSGLLDCPGVQAALTADQQRAAAAACAGTIGPTRAFYSTAEHAEDLDAVRQALGLDKIALYGVSYGTKLAMAYALAHPTHVERLILDSVLPPEGPDPYSANVLRDLPATLNAFCADGSCKAATSDFAGDVAAVANRLAAKPVQGKVLAGNGKTVSKRVDGLSLLSTLLDGDLNPGLAAELPAVVHAARLGNTQPLLRLAYLHDLGQATPSIELSFALYAATVCRDGPFPWSPDTPVDARQAILNSAVAALPAGTFGPFGSWAYRFGNADFCVGWPSPAGGASLATGPLPDVPMLAVSGGFDMRTPTEGARADPCPPRGRPGEEDEDRALHVLDRLEDALRSRGRLADGSRARYPRRLRGQARRRPARVHAHALRGRPRRHPDREAPADQHEPAAQVPGHGDRRRHVGRERDPRPQRREPARHARRPHRRPVAGAAAALVPRAAGGTMMDRGAATRGERPWRRRF